MCWCYGLSSDECWCDRRIFCHCNIMFRGNWCLKVSIAVLVFHISNQNLILLFHILAHSSDLIPSYPILVLHYEFCDYSLLVACHQSSFFLYIFCIPEALCSSCRRQSLKVIRVEWGPTYMNYYERKVVVTEGPRHVAQAEPFTELVQLFWSCRLTFLLWHTLTPSPFPWIRSGIWGTWCLFTSPGPPLCPPWTGIPLFWSLASRSFWQGTLWMMHFKVLFHVFVLVGGL